MVTRMAPEVAVETVDVAAYTIPTDFPEQDGTLDWSQTTLVLVKIRGGGRHGLGFTYADAATARLIATALEPVVRGADALAIPAIWAAMVRTLRNLGRTGVASMAVSAVDIALWDLKARLFDLPLTALVGAVRPRVAAYGSGGFTSYPDARLAAQFERWAGQGIMAMKMKVGRNTVRDIRRVKLARHVIGRDRDLYVDANGAYHRKQALAISFPFADQGVTWFEEPVTSDDPDGLRMLRDRMPAPVRLVAGEYAYTADDFLKLLRAGAVDVLQADATRCGGITGYLMAATLARSFHIPLSTHTAPALHAHLGCVTDATLNIEYFHDHARVETLLFDGTLPVVDGMLEPDPSVPGLGLVFKTADADAYRA